MGGCSYFCSYLQLEDEEKTMQEHCQVKYANKKKSEIKIDLRQAALPLHNHIWSFGIIMS